MNILVAMKVASYLQSTTTTWKLNQKKKEEACTSKKAKWNVSRKMAMDPKLLKDMLQSKCFPFLKSV